MPTSMLFVAFGLGLVALVSAQGGSESYSQEGGPDMNLRKCTAPGQCKTEKKKLTMDANWRWVHVSGDYKNCYKGNLWVDEYCPDEDGGKCAANCMLEGISTEQYKGTYGVEPIDNGVSMKFVNEHEYGISVGSRLYVLDGENYEMFQVVNNEFAFDADMSQLECGINGAVYFIEMTKEGGKGINNNKAGAKWGTGYCDAQCPHDMKFIDGEANIIGWKVNEKDKSGNMGTGKYGACCNEMDIWEANARSQAYTPHPCKNEALFRCDGDSPGMECGDNDKGHRYKGICDKDGCDFASWRMGNRKFYGKGSEFAVNTEKKFTQVTQFLTDDGTDNGDLVEIRRAWVQDGKTIENTRAPHLEKCLGAGNSLTDDICKSQNERFGDYNHFQFHGGNKVMGESLKRGHVLAISLWDDVDVSMMWLDSWYPRDKDKNLPGISRGPCEGGDSSTPTYVRKKYPDATVYYTNFAVGCIGCTTPGVDKGPKVYSPAPPSPECPFGGKGGDDNDDAAPPRRRTSSTRRRRRTSSTRRRRRSKSSARRRRRSKSSERRRRRRSKSTRRRRAARRRR